MKDVMLDLETLGTRPGSGILSIGAVAFDTDSIGTTFYRVIQQSSLLPNAFTADSSTIDWWKGQDAAAKVVITQSLDDTQSIPIRTALQDFNRWLGNGPVCVWGNGATFDNTIIREAFNKVGLQAGWSYRNDMCYRTMKNMFDDVAPPEFEGTNHNALDDAVHQARHLQSIFKVMRGA